MQKNDISLMIRFVFIETATYRIDNNMPYIFFNRYSFQFTNIFSDFNRLFYEQDLSQKVDKSAYNI